ncbi:MAG: AAC(3) family N-acetyltransferase [Clostridia bacterium]
MKTQILNDLKNLGIKNGDCLLAHTSFSSLGKGVSAKDLIDALREAVGEEGTLLLPSLSWANVTHENPVFNVAETPVCVGYLPEYFRTQYKGVKRSVHPTHSCCAIGKEADEFVYGHENDDTPVGKNSPFYKLGKKSGKILFIGCGTEPNTSMHGVEELVNPDYLYGDDIEYTITDATGNTYKKRYHTHGFKNTEQRYERLENHLSSDEMKKGMILAASCTIMSASAVWKKGLEQYLLDPHYFVDFT